MTLPTADPMLAFLVARDDAPAHWLSGTLWMMPATAGDMGSQFTLVEKMMVAGTWAPPHLHERQREGFHMIEGRAGFTSGDDLIEADPGALPNDPKKVRHDFETLTPVDRSTGTPPRASGGSSSRLACPPPIGLPQPDATPVRRIVDEIGMWTRREEDAS